MPRIEAARVRWWAFGVVLVTIAATLLAVRVNPLETALAYLMLLAAIVEIALMTGIAGGLIASVVGTAAVVLFGQYAGVYLREDTIVNIAAELVAFMLVGPVAGGLARAITGLDRQAQRWLARAEEQSAHDEASGALRPAWSRLRLEEEVQRAALFGRPLSVVLLQLDPSPGAPVQLHGARVAALEAVIRAAQAVTQPPAVVAHAGGDRVLLILPEHTAEQASDLATLLQRRTGRELYYPDPQSRSLGKPVSEWGRLRAGVAVLDGQASGGEALLDRAEAALERG